MKILGVLLIALGATLFASPEIWYTKTRTIRATPSTEVTAKTERVLVVPRAVALLVIGAGAAVLFLARHK